MNGTPGPVIFVLDSNIFIEAKQRYYAFDICPGFWQALIWQYSQGRLISVDRVKVELTDKFEDHDELKAWVLTSMPEGCFSGTDQDAVVRAYGEAIAWVMEQDFTPAAKAEFASTDNADAWVIAFAKAVGATLVTHERPNPNRKNRVPIPNVCDALGIQYVDTFDMLRALATQFSWQEP
jgi:hypothetical protein